MSLLFNKQWLMTFVIKTFFFMPYNSIYMNITATYCMSSSTKTFNEIFLKVIVGYLLAKADEWSAQFLDTCCTVAQGQLISFLKLLLSSCKDNRVAWFQLSLISSDCFFQSVRYGSIVCRRKFHEKGIKFEAFHQIMWSSSMA